MIGPDSDKLFDPIYFKFELRQIHYEKSLNNGGNTNTSIPIEYEFWGDKFPGVEKALYDRIGIQSYICTKNTDFFVCGNLNSLNYEVIQASILKWTGTNCKSDEEINKVVLNNFIGLQILSTYFDFSDFTSPAKLYLQDANYIGMLENVSTSRAYSVKMNEVYDDSNILFGSQAFSSNYNFYSVDMAYANYDDLSQNQFGYVYISFILDQKVNQYFRSSYSFWDMFGYIGGIYGLLKALGYFIFSFLTKREFYTSVISELFHNETLNKDGKYEENDKQLMRNINMVKSKNMI